MTVAMAAVRLARCVPLVHLGAANLSGRHVCWRRRPPPTAWRARGRSVRSGA